MSDEHESEERTGPQRPPRLRNLARRIFREIEPDGVREFYDDEAEEGARAPEANESGSSRSETKAGRGDRERPRSDPWALFGAVLETGDKAKTEMVRMLAREVRTYLEALELHKDLHHILTNYSLEVSASIHLKPLADAVPPPSAEASLRPLSGATGDSPDEEPPRS